MVRGSAPNPWAQVPADVMVRIAEHAGYAAAYVYAILRSFDNPVEPGNCRPSVKQLAERTGMGRSVLYQHLEVLRRLGAITVQRRARQEGRGRLSNAYLFPATNLRACRTLVNDQRPTLPDSDKRPTSGSVEDQRPTLPDVTYKDVQTNALDHHHPQPSSSLDALRVLLSQFADAERVEVVVSYVGEANVPPLAVKMFMGQVRRTAEKHGPEPVQRALNDLATSLENGQCPEKASKLPNYFRPILERWVKAWRIEQQRRRDAEKREEQMRERAEQAKATKAVEPAGGVEPKPRARGAGPVVISEEQRREGIKRMKGMVAEARTQAASAGGARR